MHEEIRGLSRAAAPGGAEDERTWEGFLAEQFVDTRRARMLAEPERRLLLAVLVDAIVGYLKLKTGAPAGEEGELAQDERWIFSDDRRWLCSFRNICDALDIEPTALRGALGSEGAARARRSDAPTRRDLFCGKELRQAG